MFWLFLGASWRLIGGAYSNSAVMSMARCGTCLCSSHCRLSGYLLFLWNWQWNVDRWKTLCPFSVEKTPSCIMGASIFIVGLSEVHVSLLTERLDFSAQGLFWLALFFVPRFVCLRNITVAKNSPKNKTHKEKQDTRGERWQFCGSFLFFVVRRWTILGIFRTISQTIRIFSQILRKVYKGCAKVEKVSCRLRKVWYSFWHFCEILMKPCGNVMKVLTNVSQECAKCV